MQALSSSMILSVWEQGSRLHPIDRALLVLSAACPEHTRDELAQFTLGYRDFLLFRLHRMMFGDRLEAYAECPECSERLELSASCETLMLPSTGAPPAGKRVVIHDSAFDLRCPDSRDAAEVAVTGSLEAGKRILLRRCVTSIEGSMPIPDALAPDVMERIVQELASLDPQADLLLNMACPQCGHAWQAAFDIVTFVWSQVRVRARRLLQQVDALARVYGWTETDILGMSDTRRDLYVQMAMS